MKLKLFRKDKNKKPDLKADVSPPQINHRAMFMSPMERFATRYQQMNNAAEFYRQSYGSD